MQNSANFKQAEEAFKRELATATAEFQNANLELKKHEDDVLRLKKEIEEKKRELSNTEHAIPQLRSKVQRAQLEMGAKHREMETLLKSQAQMLQEHGVKGIRPLH